MLLFTGYTVSGFRTIWISASYKHILFNLFEKIKKMLLKSRSEMLTLIMSDAIGNYDQITMCSCGHCLTQSSRWGFTVTRNDQILWKSITVACNTRDICICSSHCQPNAVRVRLIMMMKTLKKLLNETYSPQK